VLAAELAVLTACGTLRIHAADEALRQLPISSKLNGEEAFLRQWF
jgi:hypothetical protein